MVFFIYFLSELPLRKRDRSSWFSLVFGRFQSFECFLASLRCFNTSRPRQNARFVADDIFKCIFLDENVGILIAIPLKYVPGSRIDNASIGSGNVLAPNKRKAIIWNNDDYSTDAYISVTRPQWVNWLVASPGQLQPWYWLCSLNTFNHPWERISAAYIITVS